MNHFCNLIKSGNFIDIACACVGIDHTTFKMWMKRGREEVNTVYAAFHASVLKAEAEREANAIVRIAKWGQTKDWRALQYIVQRGDQRDASRERAAMHEATLRLQNAKAKLAEAGVDPDTGRAPPYYLPNLGKEPDGK